MREDYKAILNNANASNKVIVNLILWFPYVIAQLFLACIVFIAMVHFNLSEKGCFFLVFSIPLYTVLLRGSIDIRNWYKSEYQQNSIRS